VKTRQLVVPWAELFNYCTTRGITFTRTRPYRKNDNCFVEQKNWPVVRQQVGDARYDTPPNSKPWASCTVTCGGT
jgi:hypothetical protein